MPKVPFCPGNGSISRYLPASILGKARNMLLCLFAKCKMTLLPPMVRLKRELHTLYKLQLVPLLHKVSYSYRVPWE